MSYSLRADYVGICLNCDYIRVLINRVDKCDNCGGKILTFSVKELFTYFIRSLNFYLDSNNELALELIHNFCYWILNIVSKNKYLFFIWNGCPVCTLKKNNVYRPCYDCVYRINGGMTFFKAYNVLMDQIYNKIRQGVDIDFTYEKMKMFLLGLFEYLENFKVSQIKSERVIDFLSSYINV